MRLPTLFSLCAICIGLGLTSCREVALMDRSYQRLYIDKFSTTLRSRLPARQKSPSSMTLRTTGTVSQPVKLAVYYLGADLQRYPALQDSLTAGTYKDHQITQDFYSTEEVELRVISAPGTTGSLSIEWYCQ